LAAVAQFNPNFRSKPIIPEENGWRERRGSNAPAKPHFPAEKLTQTRASQRDSLLPVNQGFQDEKENGNPVRVFQPPQSGVRDPKFVPHSPGAALPDHPTLVQSHFNAIFTPSVAVLITRYSHDARSW
jgi:hypothetical protein